MESYEKYIIECEEKEKQTIAEQEARGEEFPPKDPELMEKWKERRECLEMLKRELKKVRENDNSYDWDNLLDDEDEKGVSLTEVEDEEAVVGSRDDNMVKRGKEIDLDGLDFEEYERKKTK